MRGGTLYGLVLSNFCQLLHFMDELKIAQLFSKFSENLHFMFTQASHFKNVIAERGPVYQFVECDG